MKRISILGLGCLLICSLTSPSTFAQDKTEMSDSQTARGKGVVKFFNNTKGFGYISDGDGDQDSSEITSRGGGVKFFNNTKGFGYISDGDGDQDSSEITSRGGGVKFFNNTKGFGYISDDQELDGLLKRVAEMCGGPVTGCTFEVMDILRDIFGPN